MTVSHNLLAFCQTADIYSSNITTSSASTMLSSITLAVLPPWIYTMNQQGVHTVCASSSSCSVLCFPPAPHPSPLPFSPHLHGRQVICVSASVWSLWCPSLPSVFLKKGCGNSILNSYRLIALWLGLQQQGVGMLGQPALCWTLPLGPPRCNTVASCSC